MGTRFLTLLLALGISASTIVADGADTPVKNIVLVHGAWADGSSWAKVIPLLEKAGLHVVAGQNPLTSLSDDVAATKRAIAPLDGPALLVCPSYCRVVVTGTGNGPKVRGRR